MPRIDGEERKLPWDKRIITIRLLDDNDKVFVRRVEAWCVGAVAVHELDGQWVITHVHTGYRIAPAVSEAEARAVGEMLWRTCGKALVEKTQEGIVEQAPAWLVPWIKGCREAGKVLSPLQFR